MQSKLPSIFCSVACLSAVACLSTLPAIGQEVSAGITGRVTDPTGSAIVNATVVAKDLDRGTEWPTKTNEEGIYAFPRVPAGRYEVRAEAQGFKSFVQSSLQLDVNQRARVDVAMQVGGVSESVSVSAEAALLQTDTTQVGTQINPETINHMALISRNPVSLTLLAPGVVTPNPATFNNGIRSQGNGRPYVNGNREESNNFLLDGIDNNLTTENQTAYQPNLDAIQEFRMITNNASAEFGNFQGGIINVVIKSGTNQFHGNLFEDLRNDKLNANNWGNNWHTNPVIPRPPLRWNQFGGTIGGPIMRNKLFFFADYQGLRKDSPGTPSSITVFPAAFRKGDFSALLDPANGSVQLYNPYSVDANRNRAPFPNNQIPLTLFSKSVQNLFNSADLYPLPVSSAIRNNQADYVSSFVNSDQGDFKLDWKISGKDDFSGRYSNGRQDTPTIHSFPLIYNAFDTAPFSNAVLNWTRTISPTLVNEFRAGVNNITRNNGGADKGLGDVGQKLGIASAGVGLLSLQGFTYATNFGNANIGTQQLFANTTWHYADNLTIIRGRHMVKTGGQLLRQWANVFYSGNNGRTGFINFNGQFTQGPNGKSPTSKASPEADFVLGLPNDLGRGLSSGTWGQRKTIYGLYVQDDWRATDTLTLNIGLRWEYHTPLVEVEDRQSNFGLFSGQLELAGKDGNSRALYNPYKKDFQPRLGFAWTPSFTGKKLVVRGAYTISSFMEGTGTNLRLPLNPPFLAEFETVYQSTLTNLPDTNLDQGLSGLNPKNPYIGANLRLWDPNVRPSEVQQWNLTLEHQFPGNNVLSVGYIGQHGTHLIAATPFFQKRLVNGQVFPSPYLAGNPTLVSQITQVSGTQSSANQKYNALQASLHKRFSAGIEYQVSYTWSRGMSDSIGYYSDSGQAGPQSAYMQNLYDRRAEWAPTYFDAKHNFVLSCFYETPFGRGKRFGNHWNRGVDYALGGWQMGGNFSAHTGFPLTIKATDRSGTLARSARANVIGTPNDSHIVGPGNHWLDVSAYSQPVAFTFGNSAPGVVRGPGAAIFNLSLSKKFPVSERRWFELRGEAFNLANTPVFNSPISQTITSSVFGEISTTQAERSVQVVAKFYF
ncbi:MAG: TonB-dependent receptor [Acidobacteriota bacterium]|nr:TonB-dependent receptor [Acidobacteriota bacterium]